MKHQITINEETQALLDRCIPSIMEDFDMDRETMIEHGLVIGLLAILREQNQKLKAINVARKAIPKLKAELPVTIEEIDAIFEAAQFGDTASQVIMSDFKRFGRSIEK